MITLELSLKIPWIHKIVIMILLLEIKKDHLKFLLL